MHSKPKAISSASAEVISVPVMAVCNYLIISRLLPLFRRMQRLIDNINRVLREQLTGIRVVRAFSRDDAERARFAVAREAHLAQIAVIRTKIVKLARKQLGDRYSAGQSGPNAFDC